MNQRPLKALASDLGISERQFHRRLDAHDPEACRALREETVYTRHSELAGAVDGMRSAADLLKRTDPELSGLLSKLGERLSALVENTDAPAWRVEQSRRLDALCELVDDETFDAMGADLLNLPPTVEEFQQGQKQDPFAALR